MNFWISYSLIYRLNKPSSPNTELLSPVFTNLLMGSLNNPQHLQIALQLGFPAYRVTFNHLCLQFQFIISTAINVYPKFNTGVFNNKLKVDHFLSLLLGVAWYKRPFFYLLCFLKLFYNHTVVLVFTQTYKIILCLSA